MSIFESVMLICFGVSWPISIAKAVRTKDVSGKSPGFMTVICIGYISGVIHKLRYCPDLVTILYVVNAIMVACDLCLYFYYSGIAHKAAR